MNKSLLAISCFALLSSGCFGEPTRIGEPCQTDEHCGSNRTDYAFSCDHQIPGGSCTVADCTPDDPDTLDVAEDSESCPAGSRCVAELAPLKLRCIGSDQTRYVCRPECSTRNDCPEVIICAEQCHQEGEEEVCEEVCENRMECVPFWSHMPDPEASEEAAQAAENPPRACVLYGSDCVLQQEQASP